MSKKPVVLITNRFDHGTYLLLKSDKEVDFYYNKNLNELSEHFNSCKGLIVRSSTKIDAEFLKSFPQLEFVITGTSGFDHLNFKALEERGIKSFHIPETQSIAAAELTIMMIFAACRKFSLAQKQLKQGVWERQILLGKQVSGQTLGIIGLGKVGSQVAQRAQALGMKVQAFDPYIEDSQVSMLGFEELMRSSDIVSLHVPKTKKTYQMIKKETLEWMSPQAILVNMSRGDVVKEEDLVRHLSENPSFTASLDVFEKEPLSLSSPLLKLNNVVLSPHIGASTEEALKASSEKSVSMSRELLKGKAVEGELPPNTLWWGE
mgnify:CR=1 FL=1